MRRVCFPSSSHTGFQFQRKKIIRREYATRRTATLGLTTWIKRCAPKYHSPQISFIKCERKETEEEEKEGGERERERKKERKKESEKEESEEKERESEREREERREREGGEKEGQRRDGERRTPVPTAVRYTRNAYQHLDCTKL